MSRSNKKGIASQRIFRQLMSSEQDQESLEESEKVHLPDITKKSEKPCSKRYSIYLSRRTKRRAVTQSSKVVPLEGIVCKEHCCAAEFICFVPECLRVLCGHCILVHTNHISTIMSIKDILKKTVKESKVTIRCNRKNSFPVAMKKQLVESQTKNLGKLDTIYEEFQGIFKKKMERIRDDIILNDNLRKRVLEEYDIFLKESESTLSEDLPITDSLLDLLRDYLKLDFKKRDTSLEVRAESLRNGIDKLIDETIQILPRGISIQTTQSDAPKVNEQRTNNQALHWFEWGKRKLYLFDVENISLRVIDLVINFEIPSFSRSLIAPDGKIFLMGGEEQELIPKKENYMFDLNHCDQNHTLHRMSPMPVNKYDFSMCFLAGFIYVISGRDTNLGVVDSCERYCIATDDWTSIAPVQESRYAASSAGLELHNKIFLFGGRSDEYNQMLDSIEQYDVITNTWRIIKLKNIGIWSPVEVCATIPISENELLVFGGSDITINDSSASYVFNSADYSLEKIGDLKRAQVFVAPPFLYGNFVYAIGNEYYVKGRNLNRFNLKTREWELVF